MDKAKHTESGQAIVLLALAIIVLLGLTALAIDGGMAFSDRRHAQNASDASSLAGGGAAAITLDNNNVNYVNWNCAHASISVLARQEALNAAIGRAASNGYIVDDDIGDHNGVLFECGSDYLGWWDKYIDVTTKVSSTTDAYLGRLFFDGQFTNNVGAVTRIRPRSPVGLNHAVVALNEADCSGNSNGVLLGGSSSTYLFGGGIYSNGCLNCNGTSFEVGITNGDVRYAGQTTCNAGHNISADSIGPSPQPLPSSLTTIDPPNCSAPGAYNYNTTYSLNNGTATLEPGLHCFHGAPNAFTINGGHLDALGVTIYVSSGKLSVSGNATVNMFSPTQHSNPAPAIPGVLIYSESSLNNAVELTGNGDSYFSGLVYAPETTIKARGDASGDTPQEFNTQLIGKNVDIAGNVEIRVHFNDANTFNFPPKLELYK
jgi:hypothetical protein